MPSPTATSTGIAGQHAIVTGGTRGIGLAMCRRLVGLGYSVTALYRSDEQAATEAREHEPTLHAVRCDVSDPAAVKRVIAEVVTARGAPAVVVNNAGLNRDRPFLETTDEDWRQVLDTNLSGPFYVCRAVAPAMLARGGGAIVNVAATTAIRPRKNGVNYCASKAGLLHFTKCLALELAPTIRVNCLIPGVTPTDELVERYRLDDPVRLAKILEEIPLGRIATIEDVVDGLELLLSTKTAYMTGQKLIVDGGQFMW